MRSFTATCTAMRCGLTASCSCPNRGFTVSEMATTCPVHLSTTSVTVGPTLSVTALTSPAHLSAAVRTAGTNVLVQNSFTVAFAASTAGETLAIKSFTRVARWSRLAHALAAARDSRTRS